MDNPQQDNPQQNKPVRITLDELFKIVFPSLSQLIEKIQISHTEQAISNKSPSN